MLRASTLLLQTRLEKSLTIPEIAKKLKIPQKHLLALENEDEKNFPQEPYASLIVKDYAQSLGLDGQQILRLFHRDFATRNVKTKSKTSFFSFTPQFTFSLFLLICLLTFSSYLVFEYFKFNRPPPLEVNWPSNKSHVISGTTSSESTVRVNQDLVVVDIDGHFEKKLDLSPGSYQIVVESTSPSGKTSTQKSIIEIK